MKKVFLGLFLGVVFSISAGLIIIPGLRHTAYDAGYAEGNKAGITAGTTTGIAQGIADLKAEQQRQKDSIAKENAKQEEIRRMAAARRQKAAKPQPVQNWHVIDGKIAEPVVAEKAPEKDPEAVQ